MYLQYLEKIKLAQSKTFNSKTLYILNVNQIFLKFESETLHPHLAFRFSVKVRHQLTAPPADPDLWRKCVKVSERVFKKEKPVYFITNWIHEKGKKLRKLFFAM